MTWSDFYDKYTEWSESTLRTRISSLEDMGSGEEVVDVVIDLPAEKLKAQLVRKAIRQKVQFTVDDFRNLDGELPENVYRELAVYTGFDEDALYLDEDNLEWDEFYADFHEWSEADLRRRIGKLKSLGTSAEVCDAVCWMPNLECEEALYQKAIAFGVKFTEEEMDEMGQLEPDFPKKDTAPSGKSKTQMDHDAAALSKGLDRVEPTKQRKKKPGFFTALFAAFGSAGAGKSGGASCRCDGDCENCPPHYGYRYGRWYYGHGHQYGCQRCGNGGASGRTYRD